MKAIDMQTLCFTETAGPGMRDREKWNATMGYFGKTDVTMKSEEEFIQDLRRNDVQGILYNTCWRFMGWNDMGEIRERHDYASELKRKYPDVILGFWVAIDADWGLKGQRELERCIGDLGSFGVALSGALAGIPANDKLWYPYYEVCIEADVPFKIWMGQLAVPGKVPITTENPIPYVDDVACKFPEAKIICAHHPWPFLEEMISVLLRHPNVYNEQHGWSPKYFREFFKNEIRTRIKNKVMFGSDYPIFTFEKIIGAWEAEGYPPEVLEKVFRGNAQRVFGLKDA